MPRRQCQFGKFKVSAQPSNYPCEVELLISLQIYIKSKAYAGKFATFMHDASERLFLCQA
jgi:hypothetical protein